MYEREIKIIGWLVHISFFFSFHHEKKGIIHLKTSQFNHKAAVNYSIFKNLKKRISMMALEHRWMKSIEGKSYWKIKVI